MNDRTQDSDRPEGWSVEDEAFVESARQVFRDSEAGLDAATLSRLNRARQAALDEMSDGRSSPIYGWRPAIAMAGVATFAMVVWFGQEPDLGTDPSVPVVAVTGADAATDFDLLLAEESLDMLEDIEFFVWLDASLSEDELVAELETVS